MSHTPQHALANQGFTLIELLIAVLVVAVGLLGHASLQAKSSRVIQQSRYDQAANTVMSDLIQRVSAMPGAAINNEFNSSNLTSGKPPTSQSCNQANTDCDRAQFAEFELAEWFNEAQLILPELRYSLNRESNTMQLNLIWDAGLSGSGASECNESNGHQCREIQLWLR